MNEVSVAYVIEEALRDIEGYSHIWILSYFHLNRNWSPYVRPPPPIPSTPSPTLTSASSSSDSSPSIANDTTTITAVTAEPRNLNHTHDQHNQHNSKRSIPLHRGLFATRSPDRPNPIGLSCVRLISVDRHQRIITIEAHDLLHQTPVLDIKPYIPAYDSFPSASIPSWLASRSK
jgi:tRNA (Thr-GGU) A37 N-methylase